MAIKLAPERDLKRLDDIDKFRGELHNAIARAKKAGIAAGPIAGELWDHVLHLTAEAEAATGLKYPWGQGRAMPHLEVSYYEHVVPDYDAMSPADKKRWRDHERRALGLASDRAVVERRSARKRQK